MSRKPLEMANVNDSLQHLAAQIQQISAQLRASEQKRVELEQRVAVAMNLQDETHRIVAEDNPEEVKCNEPDIEPEISSGDQIQLESYKAIPEYSGKTHEYRSWRNQVARRMKIINGFKTHPKYEAALAIVRAKITGAAADVLTNNRTPYNIICILKTLDAAYTDQRPLYAIEAQMISIKQNEKTLQQFYNAINFALNAIIAKVTTSYETVNEQKSLIREAHKKAIRTFIVGLRLKTMRHILYGQQPKTLNEAYSIAQTVFYDNEHLQLEQCSTGQRNQYSTGNKPQNGNQSRNNNKPKNDWNGPRADNNWNQQGTNECKVPQPMEIDPSTQFRQNTNWRQQHPMNTGPKREYNPSNQISQQNRKFQRINQLQGQEPIKDDNVLDEVASNYSDDSTRSNTASAFLSD